MLVKLNLSLPLLTLILNHLSLSLIFGALVLAYSLTSCAILLTLTLMHSLRWHDHTVLVRSIISFSHSRSRSRNHSHAVILILSLSRSHSHTHKRLVFYNFLFLCLVLMMMVSKKGLVLGFDGDGNACFYVYVCIASC